MMTHAHIDLGFDTATPFDKLWHSRTHEDVETCHGRDGASIVSTRPTNGTNNSTDNILDISEANGRHKVLHAYELTTISDQLPEFIPIPGGFGPDVFDRAEESIKYMVLTNTWPKFVKDGCATSTDVRKKSLLQQVRSRILLRKA